MMGECCHPLTDCPQSSPKRKLPSGALFVARKQALLLAICAGTVGFFFKLVLPSVAICFEQDFNLIVDSLNILTVTIL